MIKIKVPVFISAIIGETIIILDQVEDKAYQVRAMRTNSEGDVKSVDAHFIDHDFDRIKSVFDGLVDSRTRAHREEI